MIRTFDPDKAAKLYLGGLSTSAIAERFGVKAAASARALRQRGIDLDVGRRRYDGHGGVTRTAGAMHTSSRLGGE